MFFVEIMSMTTTFLNPEQVNRALKLAERDYRPEPIRVLAKEIDDQVRVAESLRGTNRHLDSLMVEAVVEKKLKLDGLYTAWAKGEID